MKIRAGVLLAKAWASMLRQAMGRTMRGCRIPTFKNRPPKGAARWRGDRRPDKTEGPMAGAPKWLRSYEQRYASPAIRVTEKTTRRRHNLMRRAAA